MRQSEREKIAKAIDLIRTDGEGGDYHEGMELLCDLIGRKYTKLGVEPITVYELARRTSAQAGDSDPPK